MCFRFLQRIEHLLTSQEGLCSMNLVTTNKQWLQFEILQFFLRRCEVCISCDRYIIRTVEENVSDYIKFHVFHGDQYTHSFRGFYSGF
jgi:hypothetical protein